MKAISYTRVSTLKQSKSGHSLEHQREKIKRYCEYQSHDLIEQIEDAGISGCKSDRPGFQRVIEMCEKGEVDTIVIYSLSRFTRNTRDLLEFVDKYVISGKVTLHSLSEQLDTNTAVGRCMLKMLAAMNELEAEQTRERIQSVLDYKREKGEKLGGKVPYGFDVIEGTNKLTENEQEQSVIVKIRELKTTGMSNNKISQYLNSRDVKTKVNGKWTHVQIGRLLKKGA